MRQDWPVAPLYAMYDVELGKMLNPDATVGPNLAPYLRNVDVQWDRINTTDLPTMSFPPGGSTRFRLRAGDLLVCEGGEVGRASIWEEQLPECYYQKALHRLRPRSNEQAPRFMFYLLVAAATRGAFEEGGSRSTIIHLTSEKLRRHRFPNPPVEAQRAIASFLDRKTAAIDALIEKKEQLIALLEEKRQALITQAVTKGLDPNVPMKDSGIEWLGEIPAHWEVMPLRHLLSAIEQGWSPDCETRQADSEEWGVMKAGCVNGWRFREDENKALPAEVTPLRAYEIRPGDLLMSRANTRQLLGSVALVRAIRPRLLLCDKLYRLRYVSDAASGEFLELALSVKPARVQLESAASGASGSMQNIGQDTVRRLLLPLPPPLEQGAIVAFVAQQVEAGLALSGKLHDQAVGLREYRQALITAAVTGQFDIPTCDHEGEDHR